MRKSAIIIFIILVSLQMFGGFISPNHSSNECWKSLDTVSNYKGRSFDSFDQTLVAKLAGMVSSYKLNCDAGGFVILAHGFPADYFRGRLMFINRPLLPFVVSIFAAPLHLISPSYSMTFAAALLVNAMLLFFSAYLLYWLCRQYFSERVAFLSGVLFLLSPFSRSWLVQPETNVAGVFSVILFCTLLHIYAKKPSLKKLIIYSLTIGLTLMFKMNFAFAVFIIILAVAYRKYKEGIIFLVVHLLPLLAWYVWVTRIWGLSFSTQEVSNFQIGVWFFDALRGPLYQLIAEFIASIPQYFTAFVYGFFPVVAFFSLFGFYNWENKNKKLFFFGLVTSVFALLFAIHIYLPRYAFFLFPIIYPLAVIGIDHLGDWLGKYRWYRSWLYYAIIYTLIILPALLPIFKIYEYLGVPYS
jgi:4-amino-4-deoxy-L-arabinose transferase-like glycosyltransferase